MTRTELAAAIYAQLVGNPNLPTSLETAYAEAFRRADFFLEKADVEEQGLASSRTIL